MRATSIIVATLLLSSAALADNVLFTARSVDYPHPLWTDLDAIVTEIEKHDRWSAFAFEEKGSMQGAGAIGRFFACIGVALARERGFSYIVGSSPPVWDRRGERKYVLLVGFLKSRNEEIPDVVAEVGDRYSKYPLKREEMADVDLFFEMFSCPTFGRDRQQRAKWGSRIPVTQSS